MSGTEALLTKALELCTYINTISASYADRGKGKPKLVLSFDLYCLLLEYTVYLRGLSDTNPNTVEELILCDDLLFETPNRQLEVNVDFFLPANSVVVR